MTSAGPATESDVMRTCHMEFEDPWHAITEISFNANLSSAVVNSVTSAAFQREGLEISAGILEPEEEDAVPAPATSS
eukprot:12398678-Karenia_brevis.AAC.1